VRAALQRLEAQGLAEIVLNRGARVRAVSADAVAEMIELHVAVTALAARHAAARATPAHTARIRQFADMLDHVAEDGGSAREFQHLRVGFARALFESAGGVLAERLRSAAPVIPHHARALDDIRTALGQAEAASCARAILEAVVIGDADRAAEAAEALIRTHAERIAGRSAETAAKAVQASRKTRNAA